MELEFDKEIDAILRKARGGSGAAVTAATSPHLDADAVAAFVENALPQKAKLLYMEHFADCDRCRRMLSLSILMNSEAVAADAGAASSTVAAPNPVSIPWYQKFFKRPNLALAMGALVLTFSGVLGYLAIQNKNAESGASISQIAEPQPVRGGPYDSGSTAANKAANVAEPSANVAAPAANAASAVSNSIATRPEKASGPQVLEPESSTGRVDASKPVDTRTSGGSAPKVNDEKEAGKWAADGVTTAAPPPVPRTELKKAEPSKMKDDDVALSERARAGESRISRDLPAPAAKVGPTRSGPVQMQSNQVNSNVYDMSVKRKVGGKTFENRNGAWYDSTYHGQATTNYRRGTDDYKKLDGGLRSIADKLGGTVVVVWREKAYRIQ
ncbi:hypothetical protein BH10ACI3_BH10ACI3_20720 [soil metagenome]